MSAVSPSLSARVTYFGTKPRKIGKKRGGNKNKRVFKDTPAKAELSRAKNINGVSEGGPETPGGAKAASQKRKRTPDSKSPSSEKAKNRRRKKAKAAVAPLSDFTVKEIKDAKKTSPQQSLDESYGCHYTDESATEEGLILELNESHENGDETVKVECVSGESIDAASVGDSREEGRDTFKWMISPQPQDSFFSDYWEKKPLHLKRQDPQYYKNVFSTSIMDKILHEDKVQYSKNLDITSYSEGKRETHNLEGRAHSAVVWDYYNNGCSLRLLNPQTFHRPVWKLLYSLQEHFGSFCGANVYLTPPGTQGFAPHWDDIEAFILQLEGKKHWRVYKPRSEEEELPEMSSPNLSQEEIGDPVLEVTLEPGDLLYFPRGFIHQGRTVEDFHSLHITVSTYQKNTWGHYLQRLLPRAVEVAMAEDVEFRRGLPLDHLQVMGVVNSDTEAPGREAFINKVKELVGRLLEHAPFDATSDQCGASLMHDSLPPLFSPEDKACSVYNGGEHWCKKKMKVVNRIELEPDTYIRLIRGNCLRVVAEEDGVRIYHCLENTREYHQEEPQYFEMAAEHAPVVETLIHTYPKYITVESLPIEADDEKMVVASGLWERGLIVTAKPLVSHYDD